MFQQSRFGLKNNFTRTQKKKEQNTWRLGEGEALYKLLQDWEELKVPTDALASKTQESQCNRTTGAVWLQNQYGNLHGRTW